MRFHSRLCVTLTSLVCVAPAMADTISLLAPPYIVDSSTAGNRSITSNAGVEFGAMSVGGSLDVAVLKDITQNAAISIGGASSFQSGRNLTLNEFNNFGSTVSLTVAEAAGLTAASRLSVSNSNIGSNLSLTGADRLNLGLITAGSNIDATAAKTLTVSGPVTAGLATALTGGQNVVVNGLLATTTHSTVTSGLDFSSSAGAVVTTGGNANINAGRNATLGGEFTTGNNLLVSTGSALTVVGSLTTGAKTDLQAGTSAALNGSLSTGTTFSALAGTNLSMGGALTAGNGIELVSGETMSITGALSSGAATSLSAGTVLNFAGNLAAGQTSSLTGGQSVVIGPGSAIGNLAITGGQTVTINGPFDVTGNAAISGGQQVKLGSTHITGSLSVDAQDRVVVSDEVSAAQLALASTQLAFALFGPDSNAALHILGAAGFYGVSSLAVSFDAGYDGNAGDSFDLILADEITGLSAAAFSVANLDDSLGYQWTLGADFLRLSLYERPGQIPEPASSSLIAIALLAAARMRRRLPPA